MASPTKRRATYEDLLQVPANKVAEIVDGELHVSPRPSPSHALASSRLGAELGGPFDRGRGGPAGWWILDEPGIHFGEDVVVPDLGRLAARPDGGTTRDGGIHARPRLGLRGRVPCHRASRPRPEVCRSMRGKMFRTSGS